MPTSLATPGRARAAAARLAGLLVTVAAVVALSASSAQARFAGSDPTANFAPRVPSVCFGHGAASACLNAGISALDASRARLGLPAYTLPGNFTSLSGAQQLFVLTDLDRVQYGLPPIPGISVALSSAAAAGVHGDADPTVRLGTMIAYTANWAGGDPDAVWAYQAWMYNDGVGSGNLDCASAGASGCWGHRHDILNVFGAGGPLAGGFAVGTDASGRPSYAMILTQQAPHTAAPAYAYTWRAAVAAGA